MKNKGTNKHRLRNLLIAAILIIGFGPLLITVPEFRFGLAGIILLATVWGYLGAKSPQARQAMNKGIGAIIAVLIIIAVVVMTIQTLSGAYPIAVLMLLLPIDLFLIYLFVTLVWGLLLQRFVGLAAAENHYSNLIRLNARYGFGYLWRASLRQQQGDLANALEDYQRVLAVAKYKAARPQQRPFYSFKIDLAIIYNNRATIYFQQGNFADALRETEIGLALPKLTPLAETVLRFNRGASLLGLGQFETALNIFDKIVAAEESEPTVQGLTNSIAAYRAVACYGLGRLDEAKREWAKLLQREPNYSNVKSIQEKYQWPQPLLDLAMGLNAA